MQVVVAAGGVVGELPVADVEMVQTSVFGRDPEVSPAVVAELAHGVAVERLRVAVVVVPQNFALPGRTVVHAAEISPDPDAALAVLETPVDAFVCEVVSGDRPDAVLAAEEKKAAVRTDHVAVHVPPENRVDARDGEFPSLGVEGGKFGEPARVDVEFAEVAVLHADQQFALLGLDDGRDLVVAQQGTFRLGLRVPAEAVRLAVVAVQPGGRSDPDFAAAVLEDGSDPAARAAIALLQFVAEEAADALVPAEQPVVGSDPQVAQRVVQQADAVFDALPFAVSGVEPREALVPRVEKHEGFGAPQPDADSVRVGADDVDVEVLAGE